MTIADFLLQIGGTLIGGLITWLVSKAYYEKAGNELKAEAAQLRQQLQMVLESMLERRIIKDVVRNKAGEIVGFRYTGSLDATMDNFTASFEGIPTPPKTEDRNIEQDQ